MSARDDLDEAIAKIKKMDRGRPVDPVARDYLDNIRAATRSDGAIDAAEFDSHRTGRVNGGIACDVSRGPCRCGAWHY